jgi:hypothetical protein
MIEHDDWSWSPVAGMVFGGPWCDGELNVDGEIFPCDVVTARFAREPFDIDWVTAAATESGLVRTNTAGDIEIRLWVESLDDSTAPQKLKVLLYRAVNG